MKQNNTFLELLTQLLIPSVVIGVNVISWFENMFFNLITQVSSYFDTWDITITTSSGQLVDITKPESDLDWLLLGGALLGYLIINKVFLKRYIADKKDLMDFEERKRSLTLVINKVVSKLLTISVIYASLTNLGATYDNVWWNNPLNLMVLSVIIGEIIRVKNTTSHLFTYLKK